MVEYISDDMHLTLPSTRHKWMHKLLKSYPLPEATAHQCRDEFLKEILKPFKPSTESETSDSSFESHVHFGKHFGDFTESYNFEKDMYHYKKKFSYLTEKSTYNPLKRQSRIQAPNVFDLLKDRQEKLSAAIGHFAVIFGLNILSDRLKIILEMWPVTVSVDKSYKMFSWSIQDYLTRFNMPNQTYLDIAELELKHQMECFKFRVDVSEIIRLVSALGDDLKNKRDICNNSMLLIEDAKTDINELVITMEQKAEEEFLQASTAAHRTPHSADPGGIRRGNVQSKINYNDFVFPIEARYRINWAQAQLEQGIMYDQKYLKEISKELVELKNNIKETNYFWDCSQVAFEMQVAMLKNRQYQMEKAYEEHMEQITNDREIIQNKLLKAREELATNRDRIPMFHSRIAEIKGLLAQQEAERMSNMARISESRRSKKKSVGSRKSGQKKKKY